VRVPESIIFWKWAEEDLDPHVSLPKADDLCARSCFKCVMVGLEQCVTSYDSDRAHAAIVATAERLGAHGRELVLSMDARQEGPLWADRGLDHCLGWVDSIESSLDEGLEWSSRLEATFDHFGSHAPVRSEALAVFGYEPGEEEGTYARMVRLDEETVSEAEPGAVRLRVPSRPGWRVLALAVHYASYPDIFSEYVFERQRALLERYADLPLGGVALDEWGTPPQPQFQFRRAWTHPWWSSGFASAYREATRRDALTDLFHQRVAPESDREAQTRAILGYFEVLRQSTVAFETLHYEETKRRFGPDAFVGVHPTWWGLDEDHQSFEIFKNGFNWWQVPREVGQTDEVVPMGVRLALARKAGRSPFFNMWYSGGTLDVRTFFAETYRNARHAGRTHHLGYLLGGEQPPVAQELAWGDCLERVSAMEERLAGLYSFLGSPVDARVLVVAGWRKALDWRNHVDPSGEWDFTSDTLARGYRALRALWDVGYVVEFIPDYEPVGVSADGRVSWCAHTYDAAIFVDVDPPSGATRAARCDDPSRAVDLVSGMQAARNDVPSGCRLEDGTVILAADGERETGNPLAARFSFNGRQVEVEAEDYFAIAPGMRRVGAGRLHRLIVDGEEVTNRYH